MKTVDQIIADEQARRIEWERTTEHKGFKIAELRAAMESVESKAGWKLPFEARIHLDQVRLVLTAVEFFHADMPKVDDFRPADMTCRVKGNGYQG